MTERSDNIEVRLVNVEQDVAAVKAAIRRLNERINAIRAGISGTVTDNNGNEAIGSNFNEWIHDTIAKAKAVGVSDADFIREVDEARRELLQLHGMNTPD